MPKHLFFVTCPHNYEFKKLMFKSFKLNDKKINAMRSINLKILSNYVLYKNYTTIKTLSTYVVLIVVVC